MNEEYGHAMLEHLDIPNLCVLFRVDTATRTFILSLGGTKTFGEYITGLIATTKDKLLVCVELDLLDQFKYLIKELNVEEICNRESNLLESDEQEDLLDDLIEVCDVAIKKGKIEYLEATKRELYLLYDWENAWHNDYSFGFMESAVEYNRPSVVKYLLERTDEEGEPQTEDCTNAYLCRGLDAAAGLGNKQAAVFFLDHPGISMYCKDLDSLLTLDDNTIYDKYIDRVTISHFWYDNWYSIRRSLDITLSHNNSYLYEKICELALKHTEDVEVRGKVLEYSG